MNKSLFFVWLFLLFKPAYALPIPELTSTVFGIGELFLLGFATLSLYFPFLKKTKSSPYLYILLFFSIVLNCYYLFSDYKSTQVVNFEENRPGMIANQQERDKDPNSIDEEKAQQLKLEQEKNGTQKYLFVDARSQAETELGTAEGFIKLRWPDLVASKDDIKGRTIIATCWTGMRGSEVCSKLRENGIDCQYLKEGLKGWASKKLPLNLSPGITLAQFGTGEQFENSEKLLSTREAVNAKKDGATIIDTRPEKDFNKSSINGSVNLPFGELATNEMEYRIKILKTQNVAIACYGRLSCGEAPGWGWEMKRLGHTYLGAYSGGVDAFNALDNPKKKYNPLDEVAKNFPINYLLIITGIALGFVLWTTKAISMNYFNNLNSRNKRNKDLKNKYEGDIWAIQREIQKNSKQDALSILKSFGVILFVLLYTYSISSIVDSWGSLEIFGYQKWKESNLILALLASFLVSLNLSYALIKKINRLFFFGFILIFSISFIIFKYFSSIAVFIIILSAFFTYVIDTSKHLIYKFKKGFDSDSLELKRAWLFISPDTKAYRLSWLKHKGFNVPNGLVVRPQNEHKYIKTLGDKFAIRSSATNEDNENSSRAGLNLSIVPSSIKNYNKDIKAVFKSYNSHKKNEIILVQKLIEPKYAGVIFSKHPSWGGVALIEWGTGLAGQRMDGSENANEIIIERATGTVVHGNSPMDTSALYQLLLDVEKEYGINLDLEWAIDNDDILWLLQARPQTALGGYNEIEIQRDKLLKPEFKGLYACELSWQTNTNLSASLICAIWRAGGAADYASRLALWKWSGNNSYINAFNRIWDSKQVNLSPANSISWVMAKKSFNENLQKIQKQKGELLKQHQVHLAVNWDNLDTESWGVMWQKAIENWMEIQQYAFYFEFMAQTAIDECKKDKNFNTESLTGNFYSEDIRYRSEKDYELSYPRYIELNKYDDLEISKMLFGNKKFYQQQKSVSLNKLSFANDLIYLRDQYKHYCLSFYYILRVGIINAQKRTQTNIFSLDYKSVPLAIKEVVTIDEKIHFNNLPDSMDARQVALLGRTQNRTNWQDSAVDDNSLNGTFVSCSKNITGKLLKIKENISVKEMQHTLSNLAENTIIYSKYISPHLVSISQKYDISALCSRYGSTLSHPSILAREANLSFIIKVNLEQFSDGDEIFISKTGTIKKL